MSSGSFSDTVAALSDAFSHSELSPAAVDELRSALTTYVLKNKKIEADAAARLQDELHSLFKTRVETDPRKLALFMTVLRHLRPAMTSEDHLVTWFNLAVRPFVVQRGLLRSSVEDAEHFVVDAMAYDDDAPDARERARTCATLAAILLDLYMSFTSVPDIDHPDLPLQVKSHAAQQLQKMLVAFGRKRAKDLFLAIDNYLTAPNTRFQALALLAAFLEQHQAHFYLVVHTAIVEHLLKCLMNDSATVVVSAALRCLIMLLPHIPATIAAQLPRLFLVYSRCLCWEKFSASSTKAQRDLVTDDRVRRLSDSDQEYDDGPEEDPTWSTLQAMPDMPESSAPDLLHYFTYLYGLYPLNFLAYVRKPRKYLKNIDFPGADDFDLDQAVIRSRTEQFQRVHLLHPNFFHTTVEDELTDNRWLKAEPSEVIADCHGLYVGQQSILPSLGPPPTMKLPDVPPHPTTEDEPDSPTITSEGGPVAPTPALPHDVAQLQRELMLLRNEFTFERYLKQQHVAAIGQLRRNHIKAVTIEAETATLINANRALQKKLSDAIKFNEKMQKETQTRRTHTKQSEDQLTAKIRSLKADLTNQDSLKRDLNSNIKKAEQLRQLLVESEAKVKDLEHKLSEHAQVEQMQNGMSDSAKLEDLQHKISELEDKLRTQKQHSKTTHAEQEMIIQDLEKLLDRSKNAEYDNELEDATATLRETRQKLSQSRKAYTQLLDDYTNLKMRYQELTIDMLPSGRSSIQGRAHEPSLSSFDYRVLDGGTQAYGTTTNPRTHFHPDRMHEQRDVYESSIGYPQVPAAMSGYPPVRPMRPEVYQPRMLPASPSSRGNSFSPHTSSWGAVQSIDGSDYGLSPPEMVRESSKSAFSIGSEDGRSSINSKKIKAKSEVRVYGRGGAQNIKMKNKDKPEKHTKAGGLLKTII